MNLHLNLKFEYFDAIKAGTKIFEYRDITPRWEKRLIDRKYTNIILKRAYPKKDDVESHIILPYRGYERQVIIHKHFGNKPKEVFAIRLT